ncbi:hypothetical protein L3Q82_020085, partial [Scortum barcoo]
MAGPCWMAVVVAFFLSAQDSLAAVDQNWLTSITEGIKNQYALGDTFSLAVNVPEGQDPNDLQQVFQDDPADKVKQTVSEGQVYQGTRVVAAAQSGAVSRVLQNLQPLIKSSQGNFLVIYSEESPCGTTCTNEDGIDGKTNDITQNWGGYAFVFSKVGDVPDADVSQLSESFKQLEISKLGLDNIFHCYKHGDDPFECTSCSSGGDVAPSCLSNAPSNPQQAVDQESTVPPTGTDTGQQVAPAEGVSTGTGEGVSTGTGEGVATGTGEGVPTGTGEGVATGTGEGVPTGTGEGVSTGTGEGVPTGTGEGLSTGIGGRRSKCKGRGRRKGSCKPREGRKRGKGGK